VKHLLLLSGLVAGSMTALADDLPVPPVPPPHPPMDQAAPVPNVDARLPTAPASNAPTVDVRLYRARPYDPAYGFVPGSRYQSTEDRKPIQTPGLSVSVPLN